MCDHETSLDINADIDNGNADSNNNIDDDINTIIEDDDPPSFENDVTKLDTQRVIRLRMLLIVSVVTSATIMSILVYRYISIGEKKNFEEKFNNDANKVLEAVGSSLERTLGVMNVIALAYVSYAATIADLTNVTSLWPFVTLPNFALHASKLLPLTDGLFVVMGPIVSPSHKTQWEEYASQNDQWVNETLQFQEVWGNYYGQINFDWKKVPHIGSHAHDVDTNIRYVLKNDK